MIVIKLEMWPGGDESEMYPLGRAYIDNISPDYSDPRRGDYRVRICRKGHYNYMSVSRGKYLRRGEVHDYPRLSYSVWRLIIRALRAAFPEER